MHEKSVKCIQNFGRKPYILGTASFIAL